MGIATVIAKHALRHIVESRVQSIRTKLDTLKAIAESAKANAELEAITDLLLQQRAIDQKLDELRHAGDTQRSSATTAIEHQVAQLERDAEVIERKIRQWVASQEKRSASQV